MTKIFISWGGIGRFAVAFATLMQFSACQEPKLKTFDAGNPIPQKEVSDAINELLTQDPLKIQKGEFVQRSTIQDLPAANLTRVVGESALTVVERIDLPANDYIEFTIVQEVINYDENGKPKPVESKQNPPIRVPRTQQAAGKNLVSTQPANVQLASVIKDLMAFSHEVFEKSLAESNKAVVNIDKVRSASTITYHNLVIRDDIVDPPVEVQKVAGCRGLPSCKIHTRTISYDTINWYDEKSGDRVHWDHIVSPDVPYLSGEMSTCATLMVNVPEGKTLLKQCDVVVNFH